MPPDSPETTILEKKTENDNLDFKEKEAPKKHWKNLWCLFGYQDIKWFNTFLIAFIHLYLLYGFYMAIKRRLYIIILWNFAYAQFAAFGITGGAHRLYTHRSYKANLPLRIILMIGYTAVGMNPIFEWVRDHRVHHKFSDTDADPHNASRGFFFSHCGWLMMKKHPEVIKQGKKIDMTDILEDPVVQFHQKYYYPLTLILCYVFPTVVPWYFWSCDLFDCFTISICRWVLSLNAVWAVNSAAHIWGNRPYDKNIYPAENILVALWSYGEGWHNYHHTFPWDYKAAELSWFLNTTGILLNMFAAIGWAYDLKTPTKELIEKIVKKSGDGSHYKWGEEVPESEGVRLIRKKIT
ncbi:hypothetical protein HHI36_012335 [Cryptolaemus montrouzieri]